MSTQFPEGTTIKLEDTSGDNNVTEIQSYLAGFQKEIGDNSSAQQNSEDIENESEEGTYFVDQSGQYYYQAKGSTQPLMTMVSAAGNANRPANEGNFNNGNQEENNDNEPEDDNDNQGSESNGPIMLNAAGSGYQRVTVVPTDNNSGELSYVLIVQDPELKDGEQSEGDQDMAVYDFDDAEDGGIVDSDVEDDKSKIVKLVPRKSQIVAQAHMCNYCNYTSSKRYLLSRHMKSHSEERPHKCSVCERGFKTLASLQDHVNTHTGTKPHPCKYCDSAFTTSGELVRHVRYRHTHEKPHKCTECDYASVELSKLKRHIRCHTGERPYQCPHCTYASPDTFKLKRHLRIHTGEKPYECDVCHQRFTQSNSLKAHRLIHNIGDKPVFQCHLCPATCGRKTDLRIHVQKLHTSDKPLKCKRCGKTFPDRYSYKLHNKSHDGEKCFKCDLCPYASISGRHLESHMLIHTDQKPYQCDRCDQSFRQKQLLRRHENLYHNPEYIPPPPREKTHECPECSRAFRHKGNLIRHMAAHDPDPTIQRKQLELKLGRQKKIQMIDGQQVEVLTPGMASEDEEEIDMIAVEGSDGQQYVVLEVIQLNDGEESSSNMTLGSSSRRASDGLMETERILQENELDENVLKALQSTRQISKPESDEEFEDKKNIRLLPTADDSDMKNCFGFDEEEDEETENNRAPETITILGGID